MYYRNLHRTTDPVNAHNTSRAEKQHAGNVLPRKLRVGILGSTGTVGQRFIQMLERHPQFEVTAVAASERSENKPYVKACS
jgi:NADPH:quinone reductase-like Zn-dependent oxidoreductase